MRYSVDPTAAVIFMTLLWAVLILVVTAAVVVGR